MQDYSKTPGFGLDAQKYGIDPSLTTVGQQGSAFGGLFGSDSFGQGGFMSSMPGYILGGLSYLEGKKNNKLSRKERNYNLARKQTENAADHKYKNNWEGINFA